jgi:transmembrane sensor
MKTNTPEALREAAAWLVRLKEADESAEREFAEWLKKSPVHVRHYLELSSLDVELQDAALFEGLTLDDLHRESAGNVVNWDAPTPTLPRSTGEGVRTPPIPSPVPRGRVRVAAFLIAAAVASIAVAALFITRSPQHYDSALGELRSITLPDGSIVTLNTQSDIEVRYSNTARTVELRRGEALFRAVKDKTRPFRVMVDGSMVQAVGTEFNVYRRAEGAIVTVIEGRVSILPPSPLGEEGRVEGLSLSAGEQLAISHNATVRRLDPSAVTRVTTWTQRRLVFDQAPVSEVVSQLNRYNRQQLLVADPNLARRVITGTFESGDPASFVQFLVQQGGVTVREEADSTQQLAAP